MKKTILTIAVLISAQAVSSNDWYTTIDYQIYETPIPDCKGCVIESVIIHQQDRWVQLITDRISRNGFD